MSTGLTLTKTEKRVLTVLAANGWVTALAVMVRARSFGLTRFTLANFVIGRLVTQEGDTFRLTALGHEAARELEG